MMEDEDQSISEGAYSEIMEQEERDRAAIVQSQDPNRAKKLLESAEAHRRVASSAKAWQYQHHPR